MREKYDLLWEYCYLMVQKSKIEESSRQLRSEYLQSEEAEIDSRIIEIKSYVEEIAKEYRMRYDPEINLFVDGYF